MSRMDPLNPKTQMPGYNWKAALAVGIVLLLGGAASILFPVFASLVVTGYAGAAFFLGGAIQLWSAFRNEDGTTGGRLLGGGLGVLMIVFAVSLFFDPLAGLVSLTVVAALFFAAIGALRIMVALRMRPRRRWAWIAASGALSLLLAGVILVFLPQSAATTLGLLLGIELTMAGAAFIAMALASREG